MSVKEESTHSYQLTDSKNKSDTSGSDRGVQEEDSAGWIRGWHLVALLLGYFAGIVLGGVIFHFIEHPTHQTAISSSDNIAKAFLGMGCTCTTTLL